MLFSPRRLARLHLVTAAMEPITASDDTSSFGTTFVFRQSRLRAGSVREVSLSPTSAFWLPCQFLLSASIGGGGKKKASSPIILSALSKSHPCQNTCCLCQLKSKVSKKSRITGTHSLVTLASNVSIH